MPLYVYRCETCGEEEEVLGKHSDPAPLCRNAHGPMKRIASPPRYNKRQGQSNAVTDDRGNTTTEHWDGRQDVTVRPEVTKLTPRVNL